MNFSNNFIEMTSTESWAMKSDPVILSEELSEVWTAAEAVVEGWCPPTMEQIFRGVKTPYDAPIGLFRLAVAGVQCVSHAQRSRVINRLRPEINGIIANTIVDEDDF